MLGQEELKFKHRSAEAQASFLSSSHLPRKRLFLPTSLNQEIPLLATPGQGLSSAGEELLFASLSGPKVTHKPAALLGNCILFSGRPGKSGTKEMQGLVEGGVVNL